MKKILYFALFAGALMATACNPETKYHADSDRYVVTDLKAVPGDEEVSLEWTMKEGWSPVDYLVSYNDAEGEKVSLRTGSTETSYTVSDLENDVNYVFAVQAVYSGDRLSGSVKTSATPVTSRIAVSEYKLDATDGKITASWTLPQSENCTGITLVCKVGDEVVETKTLSASSRECVIEGLTNYKEYEVTVEVQYKKGPSGPVSAKATPVGGPALCSVLYSEVYSGQLNTFTFNSTDYPTATGITWTFNDGQTATGTPVQHRIWGTDEAQIVLNVNINGTAVEYKFYVKIHEYALNIGSWSDEGIKFKNTNFAYSPDRKTAYVLSYGSARLLEAINLETGEEKWYFNLGGGQGNGAHLGVNPVSGDVVISSDKVLYCIKPDGSARWSIDGFGTSCGDGAAFSPDAATVYVGNSSGDLWAIKADDGTKLGSVALGGSLAAIVVDGTTLFVTIRLKADPNAFFFDVSDPTSITTLKTLKFDSRGADIASASVSPDKTKLYFSADQNFYCVDLTTREIIKSVKTSDVSGYIVGGSVVTASGDVAVVYASASAQSYMSLFSAGLASKKWDWAPESHKNTFNFNCPTVDEEGSLFISDRNGKVWCVSSTGTASEIFAGPQILQGAMGMCGSLVMTAGNKNPGIVVAKCVETSRADGWSGCGGDPCCTKCVQWAYR